MKDFQFFKCHNMHFTTSKEHKPKTFMYSPFLVTMDNFQISPRKKMHQASIW